MVVLLYPDISNFTFENVKNVKCKFFLIDFLNLLGNFQQKNANFFHFTTTDPISNFDFLCHLHKTLGRYLMHFIKVL